MIARILKIRLKQLVRIIFQLGIFRTIFILVLLGFVSLYIFTIISEKKYQGITIISYLILILIIQIKRKDKQFLNLYETNLQKIFFIEYLIISIPILIPIVTFYLWHYLLIYITSLFIISLLKLNLKKVSINTVFQNLIPDDNFEWKAGIRKNIILFLFIWSIGMATSFYTASVPIAIFILSVIVLNFYETPEPLQILIANELNAKKFLWNKIKKHLLLFSILIIPLVLLFSIFNMEYFYIALIEYLVFSIILIYTILLKYAFYKPNTKSGATQIFTMIGIISIFIPIFIPVILLLSVKSLLQSLNNLNIYLYDYNQ